jgi:hypothetical protein
VTPLSRIVLQRIKYDDRAGSLFLNSTFAKPENRMRFFKVAEQFLAKHLGGRFEP